MAMTEELMLPRDVFWIASCTKLITAICCTQLVERGHISLDDAEGVERLCPELQGFAGVCEGKDADSDSAAGFGYSCPNHALRDYGRPAGYDEFSGCFVDFMQPLVNQPGDVFEYGIYTLSILLHVPNAVIQINIDWADIVLERLTGQRLGQYMWKRRFSVRLDELILR
ncbi:hypothetical protein M752DRAFT_270574 [Aspergillus phoenicis ATCC 13157]|uniref:Beta-lactamase-related domain-containing protein n=1 Tax=Aspergillus phoenicis ATCC 13157 TaxID=1353007 RepID=A0A370P794_ASPPH|nr:hypothetical protein M752DRAFT_270574 [Aspergillus phoenicis ATCC 13157]